MAPTQRLLDALAQALVDGRFQRLVLGGPTGEGARRISFRPVDLRAGSRIQEVVHDGRTDRTRQLPPDALVPCATEALAAFRHADLFLADRTLHLEVRDGRAKLREAVAAPVSTNRNHDRHIQRPLDGAAPWLRANGLTDAQGRPRPGHSDKVAQIHRFAELLGHAVDDLPRDQPLRAVDLGCGKGWLAFATRDLLDARGFRHATVLGVDRRDDLVQAARTLAGPGLDFQAGDIDAVPLDGADVVVALHACDTATDDALFRAVAAGASRILVSPCCHRELRPLLQPPEGMAAPFRHGIFVERQAEWVTDALRAALLGACGYRVTVAEFVPTEHTPRNLLITASLSSGVDRAARRQEAVALARATGLPRQRLADALDIDLR